MTPRDRVAAALAHREPDRVPLDLGGCSTTGMHVSSVYALRQALGLDRPGSPVKVIEPVQMLGEIADDLKDALGVDVVGVRSPRTPFGFPNEGWKSWRTPDGTPVLVPSAFNTAPEPDGALLQYPGGDRTAPPSGRMPAGGWYHDVIVRQEPLDGRELDPADNTEEFQPVTAETVEHFRSAIAAAHATGRAVVASFGGTGFGDVAHVPGPALRHPQGIRDVEEWYLALTERPAFVRAVFARQCEVALANLERFAQVAGDRVSVAYVSGADFGGQSGPLVNPRTYRELFQPFHRRVNGWIHRHTGWKTFIHSCGAVSAFLDDFLDAGFEILNPVQCTAAGMDPETLKRRYGDRVVFWGGGVNTQTTLPFGSADDVRREVRERLRIFGRGGGYVFNPIHNVQARVPVANLLALYETVREAGSPAWV